MIKINEFIKTISLVLFYNYKCFITSTYTNILILHLYLFFQMSQKLQLGFCKDILSSPFLDETLKNFFNWSTCFLSVSENINKISDYLNEFFSKVFRLHRRLLMRISEFVRFLMQTFKILLNGGFIHVCVSKAMHFTYC